MSNEHIKLINKIKKSHEHKNLALKIELIKGIKLIQDLFDKYQTHSKYHQNVSVDPTTLELREVVDVV